MKAQELRIGNLVDSDALSLGVMIVESILSSANRVYLHSLDSEYLADFVLNSVKPIPLTEEWLLKFGFEKEMIATDKESCYGEGGISLRPTGGWINTREYEKIIVYPDWIGNQVIIGRTHIKYVHQLQNLYFALTGEELSIKQDAEKAAS